MKIVISHCMCELLQPSSYVIEICHCEHYVTVIDCMIRVTKAVHRKLCGDRCRHYSYIYHQSEHFFNVIMYGQFKKQLERRWLVCSVLVTEIHVYCNISLLMLPKRGNLGSIYNGVDDSIVLFMLISLQRLAGLN
jgi:hypothetical protein